MASIVESEELIDTFFKSISDLHSVRKSLPGGFKYDIARKILPITPANFCMISLSVKNPMTILWKQ